MEAESSASTCSGPRQASKAVLLPLCTEYDFDAPDAAVGGPGAAGAAAPGRMPSIKVELSYSAHLSTMDAAEAAAVEAAAAESGRAVAGPEALPVVQQKQLSGFEDSSGSDGEELENSLQLANRSRRSAGSQRGASGRQQREQRRRQRQPASLSNQQAPRSPATASPGPATNADAPRPPQQPPQPSVPAKLSVEIVRACGLVAAVREAAAAAAGSAGEAGSLGRASAVGPHAFARLALFADGEMAQYGGWCCHFQAGAARHGPMWVACRPRSLNP